MTDKQIIIDGVPVQDCCYFDYENDGYEDSCYIHQNECSAQNCYYKQLKAKEQECEELKKLLKVRIEDLCDSCGASSMMPMPCKVYEKTLTEIKEIAESEIDSKEFMAIQCMLNGSVDNKNKVLKQILQKISECEVE